MANLTTESPAQNGTPKSDLPSHAIFGFLLITILITWGIAGFYIFFPETAKNTLGELSGLHPVYFLAAWAPGIAGFVMVTLYGGTKGLRKFLSRLFIWRSNIVWWMLILVGLPLIFVVGSLIKGGPILAELPEEGLAVALLFAVIMLFLGPLEEFGWRGTAQPILQRHVAPIWAALIIGVVWGVWHLPAFYLTGVVYTDWSFPVFLSGVIALSILMTAIFNSSRGSLLLPILFHWQSIIPFWPDAQPWDTWLMIALAALVVWTCRKSMFNREGAVTQVIPD